MFSHLNQVCCEKSQLASGGSCFLSGWPLKRGLLRRPSVASLSDPLFNHSLRSRSLVPRPVAAATPHQLPWARGGRPTTLLRRTPVLSADNGELGSLCPDDLGTDRGH